jgi:hypothetical protein
MSEDFPNSRPRIPRPGSFDTDTEPVSGRELDTAALLLSVQEELDQQELSDGAGSARHDVHFDNERKCAEVLSERGSLDEWRERAAWFEHEAELSEDPSTKARLLLLASEHHAATGDVGRARAVASLASTADDDLAARQERQLAYEANDLDAVRKALALETENARTVEERAHAAFYLAEIERLRHDSTTQAVHYFDLGQRLQEGDPRAALFKLARQLGQSGRAPTVKWPDAKELEPLRFASAVLGRLRGDRTRGGADETKEPLLAFFETQQALARGKAAEAGQALQGLFFEAELGAAARWLAAALLAPDPSTRPQAVSALSELLDLAPSAALRRTLAARSLEAGRPEAARKALFEGDADDEPAFGDIERIALGALLSASEVQLRGWLENVQKSPSTRGFAWAMTRALGGQPRFQAAESPRPAARLELACLLEALDWRRIEERLPELRQALPEDALLDLLAVELARAGERVREVAESIVSWAGTADPEGQARARFAAGLLLERAKLPSDAVSEYRAAFGSAAFGETAYRAVSMLARNSVTPSERLRLAEALGHREQKEILLTELALSLLDPDLEDRGTRESALDSLLALDRTVSLTQRSPLAALLEERRFATRNDREGLRRRLEESLGSVKGPFHTALLRARLYALGPDPEAAKTWLAEALGAWPRDAALVADFERHNQPPALETAQLRERLARSARTPWSKARLLLEAALHFEAANAHEDAARAAKESDVLVGTELAKLCFSRNALHTDEAGSVEERWMIDLQSASEANRLQTSLRLADLHRTRGNPQAERQWLDEAHRAAPARIDVMVELEQLLLRQRLARDLLPIETELARALQGRDRIPHALLQARRERVQKGWPAGYAALQLADQGADASLYTLRQLQVQARRNGDDAATLDLSQRLLAYSEVPNDRVILLLRAAASALRLGEKQQAEALAIRAQEILPEHLLLQHFLATALSSDDPAKAAIARENVAKGSKVAKHQAQAWYDAATLWLDRVGETERGIEALRRAAELDPTHVQVFERLFRLLQERADAAGLLHLVDQRLSVAKDPEERSDLFMLESQLHRETDHKEASRSALQTLLNERADYLPALERLATWSQQDGDTKAAERTLIQLARLSTGWEEQAQAYLALGKLYQNDLANLERAERSYQEVLRRKPNHPEARAALLPIYLQQNEILKARQHFEETLTSLPDEPEQRAAFLEFVALVSKHVKDETYQCELLDQAVALWPLDPHVLDAAVRTYLRLGQTQHLEVLEEQTFLEVSRKLNAGFLEPRYLAAAAAVCTAKGQLSWARLIHAMAAALGGQPQKFPPLHGQAMQRTLDEKLAPSPMVSPLRTLLMLTRGVLEHAFVATGHRPVIQRADSTIAKRVRTTASQAGVPAPTVCLDATFPYACWLNGARDMQLIFGERLHNEATNEELDFLIWRNLKLAQAKAGVFTRLDAAQTKVAVVAFLSCFVDVTLTTDWDTAEFEQVKARVAPLIPSDLDDDVPVLALEALHSLAKSGEHLALAARKWANRTALLATGNIQAALSALTRLSGQTLSPDPVQRLRQLADNPETRDLVSSTLLSGMGEALSE